MATSSTPAPAPLPWLRDARHRRLRHYLDRLTLAPGDQLLTTTPLLGFPLGARLPVYGYYAEYDANGLVALWAYVRPLSPQQPGAVAYADRRAVRWPVEYQREKWFGSVLLFALPLDLIELGDCLALARPEQPVGDLLQAATERYRLGTDAPTYRQAA